MTRLLRLMIAMCVVAAAVTPVMAQISFTTAVDLALRNSPRVRMAQADVDKARAALEEARDVYVPTLMGGSGLGYSYGFPVGQPSIFNFTSQSLIFNYSQHDYLRAARSALESANFALMDVRQTVAEDAALTYIALDRDRQRQEALGEQSNYAGRLVSIVQDRLDGGQDTSIDLTVARLSAAQIRLARLRAEDEMAADQFHLARLTGLPVQGLGTIPGSIPVFATPAADDTDTAAISSPAVDSAYANVRAKQEIAFGDARYLWRPQIYFVAQYNRYTTYNNYELYYKNFQHNNAGIGVQINLPILDMVHKAKARESAADAIHARYEADLIRSQFLEGRQKIRHSTSLLAARAEVASLDQQLAQQQLDVLLVQLKSGTGNPSGTQMTPKDEQTSRVAEREKFLAVLDANYQVRQAQIALMRQTGQLEQWIKSAAQTQPVDASKP
jgi:outer membrane protein TolC